jgi:hypothetical protein
MHALLVGFAVLVLASSPISQLPAPSFTAAQYDAATAQDDLASQDPERMRRGLEQAANAGDTPLLRHTLDHSSLTVAAAAALALGKLKDACSVPALVLRLLANEGLVAGGLETRFRQLALDDALVGALARISGDRPLVEMTDSNAAPADRAKQMLTSSPKRAVLIEQYTAWWDAHAKYYRCDRSK